MDAKTPTLLESIVETPSRMTEMLFYRDRSEICTPLLDHDGDAVTIHGHLSNTDDYRWKALYEALHGNDVLLISPHGSGARGAILLIEDEIDRSSISKDEFGVERESNSSLVFDSGGVINSINGGGPDGDTRIRGYDADFLAVDLWTEDHSYVTDETIEDAIIPISDMGAQTWVAHSYFDPENPLIESLLDDGCFVIKP